MHAALSGFMLKGIWIRTRDRSTLVIPAAQKGLAPLYRVHCARPVRNAAGSASGDTVDMDPEDQRRVQEDMRGRLGFQ